MQSERHLQHARLASVVAATFISLACGSNYVFSAWGPAFAARMQLSATETNLIATFGNLGMYLSGIPVGLLVDKEGTKPAALGGAVSVSFGYYMLHRAYTGGPGSIALPWLCILMFLTGLGGCAAFAACIKTSALNWPEHRGTATAFPLAAFGLSAFFFAAISSLATDNNAGQFLLILAIGGFALIFLPTFFLRVVPRRTGYKSISQGGRGNKMRRVDSNNSRKALLSETEPDASTAEGVRDDAECDDDPEITASPNSEGESIGAESAHKSIYSDVRGLAMVKYVEFYQYFLLLGILCGVGLMSINNIGNDAQALWTKYDPSMDLDAIRHRQSIHVSVLSIFSFLGRLMSGIGSDLVVKKLHLSRIWCLFISACIFLMTQICGLIIENPNFLFLISGLTGLAYGFLFGCFPSAIAETFGVGGLSTNWGVLTTAPVISANIFNLMYGKVYDSHSHLTPDSKRECLEGRFCYHEAYWGTFAASVAAAAIALWSIWQQRRVKEKLKWWDEGEDEHLA